MAGPFWLLVPVNNLGKMGRSRDFSLPWSAGFQDNLEDIHAISRLMCTIFQKMLGGFLRLHLEYVKPKFMKLLVIIKICAIYPGCMMQYTSVSRRCNHHAMIM